MKEQDVSATASGQVSNQASAQTSGTEAFNLHAFVPPQGALKSFAVTFSVSGDGVVISSTDVTRFFNSAGQLEYEYSQIHTVAPPAPVEVPVSAPKQNAPGPFGRLKQWWAQRLA